MAEGATEIPLRGAGTPPPDEGFPAYDLVPQAPPSLPVPEPPPAPLDLSEYDAIGAAAPSAESTSTTQDFSEYDAVANRGAERTAAEVLGIPAEPTPAPTATFDTSEYDAVAASSPTALTEKAVSE